MKIILFVVLLTAFGYAFADEVTDLGIKMIPSETAPNPALEKAILTTLDGYSVDEGSEPIHYYFNKIDLNGDSKPEVFVYLAGSWTCGSGGCNALVLRSTEIGYKVVTQFTVVNTPVLVATTKTNGWSDLIFPVGRGGVKPGYRIVRFHGTKYPGNPTTQPSFKLTKDSVQVGLCSDVAPGKGIPLIPAE